MAGWSTIQHAFRCVREHRILNMVVFPLGFPSTIWTFIQGQHQLFAVIVTLLKMAWAEHRIGMDRTPRAVAREVRALRVDSTWLESTSQFANKNAAWLSFAFPLHTNPTKTLKGKPHRRQTANSPIWGQDGPSPMKVPNSSSIFQG